MPTSAKPKHRVAVVLGTRPEAIKMAPVIQELRRRDDSFETVVVATSQQREMLAQAMHAFSLAPDIDLGLTHVNQTLADFTARALLALTGTFREIRPDDTSKPGSAPAMPAARFRKRSTAGWRPV
jgi:UDP-N-acetylglucosamine 2-epimerase (non-hydrolysing)